MRPASLLLVFALAKCAGLLGHQVPVSAGLGATIATGRGAAGRRALPVYQQATYAALRGSRALADQET